MTTRTTTRKLLCAAMAGSLVFLAGGCGDSDDGKAVDDYVTADKLCGGGAVTEDAAKALQVITGDTRFAASGTYSTVADAAEELTREAVPAASGYGDICRLYPEAPVDELRVTWDLSNMPPREGAASEFTILSMGEEAGAAHDTAFVTFPCSHKEHPLARPDYISVWVEATGRPTEPEGDVRPQKNAYATVTHSFALAMAKELGCEENGGLKAKPSLIPVT
ncbi:hypothetical protein [Streptomyces niveus]|uniref:DUF3558 domain-containing protein n=1 Tax=Streptomyces niveus TaxID=193462 RepID=A0ABZ2A5S3_STRNV|nr:hypothetical protein [Streptomyces niveus]